MNDFFKMICVCILSGLMGICTLVSTSAQEKIMITKNNVHDSDQFVVVKNNQFVLDIPEYVVIEKTLLSNVIYSIKTSNTIISENSLMINESTKQASLSTILSRLWGTNNVVFRWNSVTIYLDAGNTRLLAAGGVGALDAWLGTKGLPKGATIALGALNVILSLKMGEINDGTWLDYNWFYASGCMLSGPGGWILMSAATRTACGVRAGFQ